MAAIARWVAVAGVVICVGTAGYLSWKTHGNPVVGAATIVFAGLLAVLAATCALLDRRRRRRPSVALDAGATLCFLLMLLDLPLVCWLVVTFLDECVAS